MQVDSEKEQVEQKEIQNIQLVPPTHPTLCQAQFVLVI